MKHILASITLVLMLATSAQAGFLSAKDWLSWKANERMAYMIGAVEEALGERIMDCGTNITFAVIYARVEEAAEQTPADDALTVIGRGAARSGCTILPSAKPPQKPNA